MTPAPARTTLDYARRSLRLGPWLRRGSLLAWAALTAYLVYDKWGLWWTLQWRLFQAERTCAAFVQPPGTVAYEGDPMRSAALIDDTTYRRVKTDPFADPADSHAPPAAAMAVEGLWSKRATAFGDLEWWDARDQLPSQALPATGGLFGGSGAGFPVFSGDKGMGPTDEFPMFVHARRAPAGKDRLVRVTAFVYRDVSIRFGASVFTRGGLLGRPEALKVAEVPFSDSDGVALKPTPAGPVRLFAPQPDPTDVARFTIGYEAAGRRGVVEGRLRADDEVDFSLLPDVNAAGPGR